MLKKFAFWAIFVGLLGGLSIVLFERALIWFAPNVGNLYEYDPDLGFKVRSHTNGSNAFGFNDRDYPLQKQADHFRMVILGDSFSWAGGKDNNYTAQLEKRFEAHYGHQHVEVINAGYSMTHTGEQLALLKKYAIQYQPDLLVLGFFCGNDILDADPYRKRIVIGGVYVDIDPRLEFSLLGGPVLPGVIFLSTLKKLLVHATESFNRRIEQLWMTPSTTCQSTQTTPCPALQDTPGTFSRAAFFKTERKSLSILNIHKHATGNFDTNIQFIFNQLSVMQDFLQTHRTALVVALYPDVIQVNTPLRQEILASYHLDEKDYNVRLVQELMADYLHQQGIPTIDLLDRFQQQHEQEPLYLPRDTHWNEAGNTLAADILFTALLPQVEAYFVTTGQDAVGGQGPLVPTRGAYMDPVRLQEGTVSW